MPLPFFCPFQTVWRNAPADQSMAIPRELALTLIKRRIFVRGLSRRALKARKRLLSDPCNRVQGRRDCAYCGTKITPPRENAGAKQPSGEEALKCFRVSQLSC